MNGPVVVFFKQEVTPYWWFLKSMWLTTRITLIIIKITKNRTHKIKLHSLKERNAFVKLVSAVHVCTLGHNIKRHFLPFNLSKVKTNGLMLTNH